MIATLQESYANVNDLRLHYVSAGAGKVMLFLHGFPEFWYMWKRQLSEFGEDFHAIALDLPGYNLSDKPLNSNEYRISELVKHVHAFIDQVSKGKKIILVGHDWGGVVAWNLAIAHPECLEKLVIINCPHPAIFLRELTTNPLQQQASKYIWTLAQPNAESLLQANDFQVLSEVFFNACAKPDALTAENRQAYIASWQKPGALAGMLNYYPAFVKRASDNKTTAAVDRMNRLMRVKVPTLVIWGELDRALLKGNLDGLEELVPNLVLKKVPDATHWIVHEKPELINDYIRDFVES